MEPPCSSSQFPARVVRSARRRPSTTSAGSAQQQPVAHSITTSACVMSTA
ncbi:hypothetical protein PVAP13_3NG009564 [Panicum virgatum]|uniref:Uncharacterized protein n=1 Tax=Panicum virgatum TaxID=38727 RepID=A0A8T0U2Z8_PANVG|nr:hypothetical protein PVAP13_3NG009564 [Panicum virgatum]